MGPLKVSAILGLGSPLPGKILAMFLLIGFKCNLEIFIVSSV